MNVATLDALTARLTVPHWRLVTDRTIVENTVPPLLLVELDPYGIEIERYGPASHRHSTFRTTLIDVSVESALWRFDRLSELLTNWRPLVDGALMGRVVAYTAPRMMPPDDSVAGRTTHSVVALWELDGDVA